MEKGLVLLSRYRRRYEAESAAGLLRSCGIPAFIFQEDLGGQVPRLEGAMSQYDARLMVPEQYLEEARAILAAEPGCDREPDDGCSGQGGEDG